MKELTKAEQKRQIQNIGNILRGAGAETHETANTPLGYKDMDALRLDWINNFLTTEGFASYHGISTKSAEKLIDEARAQYNPA